MSSRSDSDHWQKEEEDAGAFDANVWAAVSGDLTPSEEEAVRDELLHDLVRARRAREARALQELLPIYSDPVVTADFDQRVLDAATSEGLVAAPWFSRRVSLPLPLVAAALLLLGAGATWLVLDRRTSDGTAGEIEAESSLVRAPDTEVQQRSPSDAGSFGPRLVIGAAGSAAGFFDFEEDDELFDPISFREEVFDQPAVHLGTGDLGTGEGVREEDANGEKAEASGSGEESNSRSVEPESEKSGSGENGR